MRSIVRAGAWLGAIAAALTVLLYLFVLDVWEVGRAVSLDDVRPGDRVLVARGWAPREGQLARCRDLTGAEPFVAGRIARTTTARRAPEAGQVYLASATRHRAGAAEAKAVAAAGCERIVYRLSGPSILDEARRNTILF